MSARDGKTPCESLPDSKCWSAAEAVAEKSAHWYARLHRHLQIALDYCHHLLRGPPCRRRLGAETRSTGSHRWE